MDNIKSTIIDILKKVSRLTPENLNDNTRFSNDLGFDSIRLLSFAIELEELFGIEFDEKILGELPSMTIGELEKHLMVLINNKE